MIMKQAIRARIMKLLSCIAMICAVLGTCMLAGANEKIGADLVVYGKIFTSENNQLAEAFAVKDGKYVYVGDRTVESYSRILDVGTITFNIIER